MPKYRKATKTTIHRVLRFMADQCEGEKHKDEHSFSAVYADEVNRFLDDLLSEDFFGTEGQLDPRGDHREVDS